MARHWIVVLFATGAAGLATADVTAQTVAGVGTFKDALSMESVGAVSISPDGATVAYTVQSTAWEENGYDSEIWIASPDGEPIQLTRTLDGSSGSPAWSPDGRWIAFAASRGDKNQVFLISPRGGEAFPVTDVEQGVSRFAWSPEGGRLMLVVSDAAPEGMKARSDLYGEFAFDDEVPPNAHLWVVTVDPRGEIAEARRLTEGDFHVSGFDWSPDGSQVAYVRVPDPGLISSAESDIYVLDVATAESRPLVTGPGSDGSPEWSPDGQWILFSEFDRDLGSSYYLNGELARIPSRGGEIEVLTRDFDEDLGGAKWTPNGIRLTASHRTARKVYTLNVASRTMTEMALPSHVVGSVSFTPDGRTMAFTGQGDSGFSEVYVTRVDVSTPPVKLTDMSSQLDGWMVGTREVITWKSEDGAEIEGVLHKPEGYDPSRRYPLLVVIHGGPTGTSRPVVNTGGVYPITHWLAKGAVVLEPNYRGSAGYGEAFRSLNVRNLGVGDMWDVMSGVDYLVDAGIADPERMGSMGWSQGGYISAFLTTNTDRFSAISVGAGISNWMTYYVNTDIHPFTRQYLKGTPWSDPAIYAVTSPITNILQASTPTLIQHGELDRRVPTPNAYELYQGLQDVGVEARLVIYKGFGHGITKPKERLAANWHNWQWFAKYIWGEEVEIPLEEMVSTRERISSGEGGR
ncbi:MAG: S9 family peptidase [Gemmatimonadetes bacterium]|nr:S9 family peptidase [Gemmatimonadota bacterium]